MVLFCRVKLLTHFFSRHPKPESELSRFINWPGQSGNKYQYEVYPVDTVFRPLPGNYIYAKPSVSGGWIPIYIAQTRDMHQRLEGSLTLQNAIANGATHVHAHYGTAGQAARCTEERDLILRWRPACNEVTET
jgi:hypothetical protein